MNRREFVIQSSKLLGGFALFRLPIVGSKSLRKITILHTNDTHARIDPFPDDHFQYPGMGGFAKRAALVKKIRQTEKHVILLDAGDVFQGTAYFNQFGGVLDYQLMSKLGYDASTLGNHEFDNGVEGWLKAAEYANFPFLNSNFSTKRSDFKEAVKNLLIKEYDGIKIALFGLGIDFKGLVLSELHDGVLYREPYFIAKAAVSNLRNYYKCDYVICLSHLGFEYSNPDRYSDVRLANDVDGIDLIIGGHTHTFLDKPIVIEKPTGTTLISQVGFAGMVLGRIDIYFSEMNNVVAGRSVALNTKIV